jgi:hypothetical protein
MFEYPLQAVETLHALLLLLLLPQFVASFLQGVWRAHSAARCWQAALCCAPTELHRCAATGGQCSK